MHTFMCVCVYVCAPVCTCLHVGYVCLHVVYVCVCVCVCVCVYVCVLEGGTGFIFKPFFYRFWGRKTGIKTG